MNLFEELNNYMIEFEFRPNRKLAQNFLINKQIVDKLIQLAELKSSDKVLEIGSGTGTISFEILQRSSLVSVELDETLCKLLEKRFSENKKFKLICEDFLKADLPDFNKVISAPPYNISSKLIYKLTKYNIEIAILLMQKEFIEKLIAFPGFKEYSAITIITNYFFEPVFIQNVSPSNFFPKPNDFSAIMKLTSKKRFGEVKNEKVFIQFIKNCFRFKNKNLSNVLIKLKKEFKKQINKDKLKTFLEENELSEEKIQLIEVKDFVKIFNQLFW